MVSQNVRKRNAGCDRIAKHLGIALFLGACSESALAPRVDSPKATIVDRVESGSATATFERRDRVDVELRATGEFTPGATLILSSEIRGLRGTSASQLSLRAVHAKSIDGSRKQMATKNISAASGSLVSHNTAVTFAAPGYYPVITSVSTSSAEEQTQDRDLGVPVSNVVTSNRWILIDKQGGRIDDQYDPRILDDTSRYLTEGSTGEFRPRLTPAVSLSPQHQPSYSAAAVSSVSTSDFNGRITYQRFDFASGAYSTQGVAGARVYGYCASIDDEPVGYFDLAANAQGIFSVDCNTPEAYRISVQGALTGLGVQVNGSSNNFAGVNGSIFASSLGQQVDLAVINNEAAQVFVNHLRYNVNVSTMFGRSRSPITYRVSNGAAFATNYDPGLDFIRIGPNSAVGRNGVINVVHEYGHAFHYVAIEPWATYFCSSPSNVHAYNQPYTTSCAFIEGFADFFAARVINSIDGSLAFGDGLHQGELEANPYRSLGNGLLIEASIAALFMDLADTQADIDGITADDDSVSISLFAITQIMKQCRLVSPNSALLSHSDQFINCAAGSVGERAFAPSSAIGSWAVYSGLSYDASTPLPNQSLFRALWRFNLYNL